MVSDYSGGTGRSEASALPSAMRVVRERWWIILLVSVLGLAVGLIYSATASKTYKATASVLIQPSSPISSAVVASTSTAAEDPARVAATDLLLMTSPAVANAARQALRLNISTSDLQSQVSASEEPNADLFDITASDSDPARAAQIANAFATEFVAFRQANAQQSAAGAAAELRQRLAALPPTDTTDAAALRSALERVSELGAVQTGDASIASAAVAPASPSSPKPKLDAALGLIFGLALGLGLAFVVDLTDRRIKDGNDFEVSYGLSTLVHVPARSLSASGSDPHAAAFEPYRILGGALTFSKRATGMRSLLITSAVWGEGKTTVAVGLAKALADSGHTITLVELDQRAPSLSRYFSLKADSGLTAALVDEEPVIDRLQQPVASLPCLNVLPAGRRIAGNPLEMLRSPDMDRVMEQLLSVSDIVIYDALPILGVAETQALLDHPRIDGCLIVARANRTTREEVRRARTILSQRLVQPLGLVLTGMEEPGVASSGYDHGQRRFAWPRQQRIARPPQSATRRYDRSAVER
ncbi:MAG: AAA family ATPase [Solirubrobacterales bacterium]|nr:AAA family ATPase [Solirubrobacterales bacterium]